MSGIKGTDLSLSKVTKTEQAKRAQGVQAAARYEHKKYSLGVNANVSLKTIAPVAPNDVADRLFDVVKRSHRTLLRSDKDITIRFNSNGNDPIEIILLEGGVWEETHLEVTDIFVTSTATTVLRVKIS